MKDKYENIVNFIVICNMIIGEIIEFKYWSNEIVWIFYDVRGKVWRIIKFVFIEVWNKCFILEILC